MTPDTADGRIAWLIATWRAARGLTSAALAEHLGMSQPTLRSRERGDGWRLSEAMAAARRLGIPPGHVAAAITGRGWDRERMAPWWAGEEKSTPR